MKMVAMLAVVLATQQHDERPAAVRFRPPPRQDSVQIMPTYWKEGAAIGAGSGALLLGAAGYGLCQLSDEMDKQCAGSALGFGLLGVVIGFTTGALIGGQFRKS